MKIFNYLNLVGKEITTKEMELVRGGTSDSGGTCRANGCGANEKVMANKLMANFRSVNKDLITKLQNPNDTTSAPIDSIRYDIYRDEN